MRLRAHLPPIKPWLLPLVQRAQILPLTYWLGRLCHCPLSEQRLIADYLDEKCTQIDADIAAKQAIITDLKAYKQSLIYETVTGKREV